MKRKRLKWMALCAGILSLTASKAATTEEGLQLHYTFGNVSGTTVTDDSGNGYNGTMLNSATVAKFGDFDVLKLGSSNGYLDMGTGVGTMISSLEDFTVATYLYIDESANITGAGNFVWVFSTHDACNQTTGRYIAYRVNAQRYAQSSGGWGSESASVEIGGAAEKGKWKHVVYTQSGTTGTIYIDGVAVKTNTTPLNPSAIGTPTTYNWLGRPQFSADTYLKDASYTDFRVYNRALGEAEVQALSGQLAGLNRTIYQEMVESAKAALQIEGLDAVRADLRLPSITGDAVGITWSSSNKAVLADNGKVTRPAQGSAPVTLTLTATLTKENYTTTKEFSVTVLPAITDQEAVAADQAAIDLDTQTCHLLKKLPLASKGTLENSDIVWQSEAPEYITDAGNIIKLPAKGEGTRTVKLTATVTKGGASTSKDFSICLSESEGFAGYLFAYFTGNAVSQEQIFFSLSTDGYNYKTLNSGLPVISGAAISNKGGVRDPHILRGHDGKYYMVVTDMISSAGWASNHGIVLLKSDDLVNWTHSRIDIKATYPQFSAVNRAWAPQVIYDETAGKYMVYFSLKTPSTVDIIHYAYTNADFTAFEEAPKVLFTHPEGKSCIDGDIIHEGGKYHLFFKTEGDGNGIKKAVSDRLNGGYVLQDRYLQQTTQAVEGSCVFRLIDQDKYILMYDVYTNGRYEFTESTDGLESFSLVTDKAISMNFSPRHGTTIPVTAEEVERLLSKWGTNNLVAFGSAVAPEVKQLNIVAGTSSVFVPVKYGTDLTSFDPAITAAVPGIEIAPQGAQNFAGGAVRYTFTRGAVTKEYDISVAVNNNPALPGYHADPEILYSEKTGKFYLYSTSDGYPGWGGYQFKVYSSDDLVNWTDEGVIIDMHTDQVTWANGNAWAPCIVEKKIDGEYKYFYYFSGGYNGGTKMIGVAVADHPTGPFVDSGKPLINWKPTGVSGGQEIDPDVFTDPNTGKSYIYWGNGYMAGAELNEDMVSINRATATRFLPTNFREGVYVIYRNGTYYFLWSEDDTGSENYKVRYGMSSSPLGSLNIPANNIVIQKDVAKGIYATGHNSVIQVPGKDEWYIVYHRFTRPRGISLAANLRGNHREVCIDKLEFNADGSIRQTAPTLEGIEPVILSQTGIEDIVADDNAQGNSLKVYPNPVRDMLNLQAPAGEKVVLVMDIAGRAVMSKTLPEGEDSFDCSSLSAGWYIIMVNVNGKTYFSKINKI